MILVDGQSSADETCSQDGCPESDEFPHGRMMIGEDLQLCVEIVEQEQKACPGCSAVTAWHRLKRVVDLIGVASADVALKHDASVSRPDTLDGSWIRIADSQEVRSQTADEPLDEDLEYRSRDQRVEQADDSIVHIPEASDADLHAQDDEDGDQGCHESRRPDGDDLMAERICELWIDDLAIVEEHGEGARWCWIGVVDTKSDCAHDSHGEDIEPSHLDPGGC